ncbi:hypothetical protein [Novosphingobium indicum]|nr:hypothetical protein [Novosphingobium indicum]
MERVSGYMRPARDLPATTPLMLQLHRSYGREIIMTWQDDDGGKLESKLSEIVAAVIVAGEREFRENLRKDEERLEKERIEREAREAEERAERERQRLARIAELNQMRIDALLESGKLMRQAAELRALIPQVREALSSHADVDSQSLGEWEAWARAEADKLDPVLSGQILQHLRAPTLDQE